MILNNFDIFIIFSFWFFYKNMPQFLKVFLIALLIISTYSVSDQQPKLIYKYFIFQQSCVNEYNNNGFHLSLQCGLYTISQILNIVLIPLVIFLRVPQIILIWQNKSVYGLSYIGNNFQLLMTLMTLGYGLYAKFTFWIYGENILLSLQNMVIIGLFFYFVPVEEMFRHRMKLLPPLAFSMFVGLLFVLQLVPAWCQQMSILLQIIVFLCARGSQILTNYKYKTTQNLSSKTVGLCLFANIARSITIWVQAPESIGYLLNYVIPIFVNGTIMIQIYLYSEKKQPYSKIQQYIRGVD